MLVPFTLFFFKSTSSSGKVILYLMKYRTRLKTLIKNTKTDNPKAKSEEYIIPIIILLDKTFDDEEDQNYKQPYLLLVSFTGPLKTKMLL